MTALGASEGEYTKENAPGSNALCTEQPDVGRAEVSWTARMPCSKMAETSRAPWHMPEIPAIWEAEAVRRSQVESQSGQFSKTLSQS